MIILYSSLLAHNPQLWHIPFKQHRYARHPTCTSWTFNHQFRFNLALVLCMLITKQVSRLSWFCSDVFRIIKGSCLVSKYGKLGSLRFLSVLCKIGIASNALGLRFAHMTCLKSQNYLHCLHEYFVTLPLFPNSTHLTN